MLQLNDRGAHLTHVLSDGRVLDVIPITFGRARLAISADLDELVTKGVNMEIEPLPHAAPADWKRFIAKLSVSTDSSGCWIWSAHRNAYGYGTFSLGSKTQLAHRVAYLWLYGVLPPVLDHLCRNRACVNPYHLEPVTHRENTLRGVTRAATQLQRTHCPSGHPYDATNTYTDRNNRRHCRKCQKERGKCWYRERGKSLRRKGHHAVD